MIVLIVVLVLSIIIIVAAKNRENDNSKKDVESVVESVILFDSDVERLIKVGVDLNKRDHNGRCLLEKAHTLEGLKALIAAGADVNNKNKDGETPLFNLYDGAEFYKALIKAGADVNIQDERGRTPLGACLCHGYSTNYLKAAQTLIDCGAEKLNKNDLCDLWTFEDLTPELLKFLKDTGHSLTSKGQHDVTPFFNFRITKDAMDTLLSAGCNINDARDDGVTPIMEASFFGNLDVVKMFLDAGANLFARAHDGRDALTRCGNVETAKFLISKGCDVTHTTNYGSNVLFYAASHKADLAKFFLDKGANARAVIDETMYEADRLAEEARRDETDRRLFEKYDSQLNELRDIQGVRVTPLFEAGDAEVAKLLIEAGCNVNEKNRNGVTAICINNNVEVVKTLIENGADKYVRDHMGRSAVDIQLAIQEIEINSESFKRAKQRAENEEKDAIDKSDNFFRKEYERLFIPRQQVIDYLKSL